MGNQCLLPDDCVYYKEKRAHICRGLTDHFCSSGGFLDVHSIMTGKSSLHFLWFLDTVHAFMTSPGTKSWRWSIPNDTPAGCSFPVCDLLCSWPRGLSPVWILWYLGGRHATWIPWAVGAYKPTKEVIVLPGAAELAYQGHTGPLFCDKGDEEWLSAGDALVRL